MPAAPSISIRELSRRRGQIMRAMGDDAIAVLPSASLRMRNHDVEYPFRQDSDFLWLTGFNEPEAVMVLLPGRSQGQYILFCRDRDPKMELWHGRRAGPAGAVERHGADDAFPVGDIDDILPGLLEGRTRVYTTLGRDHDFDHKLMAWVNHLRGQVRKGTRSPHEFVSLEHILHDMRLYKSRAEVRMMRHAAAITGAAHLRAIRACRPGMMEYEIEAEILHDFRRAGAEPAYPAIVGGGTNACILHYTENDAPLRDGDLVLIDAGCEWRGYAADITRTFPVNGRFSPQQRDLYEIVLEAQRAAIAVVRPGNHWDDPHMAAVRALTKGLVHAGLLRGSVAKLVKDGAYRRFYMHRTGHWLGLDVHDVGDYKVGDAWRLLEPGMAMTIEPGLYITPARGVPKRFHHTGIRIEDDVLVTEDGCEILTADCPKDPDELETLAGAS